MKLIFNQPGYYPSIEELLIHDLFRNIDLREMRHAPATVCFFKLLLLLFDNIDNKKAYVEKNNTFKLSINCILKINLLITFLCFLSRCLHQL